MAPTQVPFRSSIAIPPAVASCTDFEIFKQECLQENSVQGLGDLWEDVSRWHIFKSMPI